MTVSNSTFAGNSANTGGGISSFGGLTVSNSTFAGNSANTGGGIRNSGYTVTLKNTIVANSPTGGNCAGPITDGGGNLSYPDANCPGINSDPVLGPMQNNGGPTETMALAQAARRLTRRMTPPVRRPQSTTSTSAASPVPVGPHCDIGAVEQVPIKKLWLPAVRSW